MPTLDLLDRLLEHDAWTTRRVLGYVNSLPDKQLDQDFDIGQRTIRATLAHMIGNIEVWTDLLAAQPVCRLATGRQSASELGQRAELAYADFAQVARNLRDTHRLNELYVDVLDDPPQQKTYAGTILHVLTHDHLHRSEVLHMLQRLSVQSLIEGDVLSWEGSLRK
jgi:uncharacterized damage-inducible protein DinB